MTSMLQTFSFSENSNNSEEFDGFMATISFSRRPDTRMPEASRRQRRISRQRRFS